MKVGRLVLPAACAVLVLAGCGETQSGVFGSGTVEATEVTIAARTRGEVLAVEAQEGERVEAGTILARVDPTDVELELRQGRQRLESAEAQLDLLLAGARPEDLRQAEAQLTRATQALELARRSYQRVESLYHSGSATTSDRDRAETEFEQAQAAVTSADAQVRKLESIARPQEVRAARAGVEEARAAVARIERRLEETVIRAPRAGTITTVVREAGEYVSPGSPLFTLADLASVRLTIYVPEPSLGLVKTGQRAEVYVDGMPERSFAGRVSRIAEEAEFTPRSVQTKDARAQLVYAVEILLDNSEGIFKIGMPAEARLETGE